MKKNSATNTFKGGLIMDMDISETQSTVLTNCLNGTLITGLGDENTLQTDIGNSRIETAKLPEGYVPLGVTSFGGIIYIASYNPITNKSLLGSFPSPERSIESSESSTIEQELSSSDFNWDESLGAYIYYIKKELQDITFNPGDKFIVYGKVNTENEESFYNSLYDASKYNLENFDSAKQQTIKLSLGAITSNNKVIKFDSVNLKKYTALNTDKKFDIYLTTSLDSPKESDFDSYLNLVQQPYNVYSSKLSGKLILIAELVLFDAFSIKIKHNFLETYKPDVILNFKGENPYFPNKVICNFSLYENSEEILQTSIEKVFTNEELKEYLSTSCTDYSFNVLDILKNTNIQNKILDWYNEGYFNKSDRDKKRLLEYKFIPCMNWGPVSYLSTTGHVDLDKLGTGYIELTAWRYYKQDSKINLNWGLDAYEEDNWRISDAHLTFSRLIAKNEYETIEYSIETKNSYHGVFFENIPLDLEYVRLSKPLASNSLYLAKLTLTYINEDDNIQPKYKYFYRWMYTTDVFNARYQDVLDFKDETLKFTTVFSEKHSTETTEDTKTVLGLYSKTMDVEPSEGFGTETKSSLSGIQTYKDIIVSGLLEATLEDNYNLFSVETADDTYNIEIDTLLLETSAENKWIEHQDSNQNDYLSSKSKIVSDINDYVMESSELIDKSDILIDMPTFAVQDVGNSLEIEHDANTYKYKIDLKTTCLVKAYCTKVVENIAIQGKLKPLLHAGFGASDQVYNLCVADNMIQPTSFGAYRLGVDLREDNQTDLYDVPYIKLGYVDHNNKDFTTLNSKQTTIEIKNINWTKADTKLTNAYTFGKWSGRLLFTLFWDYQLYNGSKLGKIISEKNTTYSESLKSEENYIPNVRIEVRMYSNKNEGSEDYVFFPINTGYVVSANNYDDIVNKCSEFFNDIASVLSNLYGYKQETFSVFYLRPNAIYYMDNCSYSINVPVNVSLKNTNEKILIHLLNGSMYLDEYLKGMMNNIEGDYTNILSGLTPNISYSVDLEKTKYKHTVTFKDSESGGVLRNYMLKAQVFNRETAVYDCSGLNIIGYVASTYDTSKIYCIDVVSNDVQVRLASYVTFNKMKYIEDKKYGFVTLKTDEVIETNPINFNEYFMVNKDGDIVLKDPPESEKTLYTSDYNFTLKGYLNVSLLSKYKSY